MRAREALPTVAGPNGRRAALAAALLAGCAAWPARAVDFWSLDHFDEREDRGIFSRPNQQRIELLTMAGVLGLALWDGTETPLGRSAWQALDASLLSGAGAEVLKRTFQRPRPSQDPHPDVWFAGPHHRSFPSGEVALMAAAVTPFIVNYRAEQPAVWGLVALPVIVGRGRMASQAHWLSDVVAGAALGAGTGYYASRREQPLLLSIGRHQVFIGLRREF